MSYAYVIIESSNILKISSQSVTTGGRVSMIEKIVLAIAITFSLYLIVQIRPSQRSVTIAINFSQGIWHELPQVVAVGKI